MPFTPEWANQPGGLTKAQREQVQHLTDALFGRIKALEATSALMGKRIAELEAQLEATHGKGLRINVTDSNHARVV